VGTYLAEVVEDTLEEDGGDDDDGADGDHGPRRRLVQRPRPLPAAFALAHPCSAPLSSGACLPVLAVAAGKAALMATVSELRDGSRWGRRSPVR
jgi:hypothetical protein